MLACIRLRTPFSAGNLSVNATASDLSQYATLCTVCGSARTVGRLLRSASTVRVVHDKRCDVILPTLSVTASSIPPSLLQVHVELRSSR